MLCTKVHKPMLKRDMRRGSASLGAVAAKLRAFAQKEPTSPIIVVRTFARPNAMTSMICKFLEDRNMDFFRAVSQEDPKLSEYLPHITREIDSVIFVPKGTWRATPFLLRAAKKAGIAFIFVIDDNVKSFSTWAGCGDNDARVSCFLTEAQLRSFMAQAEDDCKKANAFACSVSTVEKGHFHHSLQKREELDIIRNRSVAKLIESKASAGVVYGACTCFNVSKMLQWKLLPSASGGKNTICDSEITARGLAAGRVALKFNHVCCPKQRTVGGQDELFKDAVEGREANQRLNELRILKLAKRIADDDHWSKVRKFWRANSFLHVDPDDI